jgi:hypothetical protein
MEEKIEHPLGFIMRKLTKSIPVEFEGQRVGWFYLYEKDENGLQSCDQAFKAEFNELILNHSNELRFSEISDNVEKVTVTRVKE